jgi:hypothetical protein
MTAMRESLQTSSAEVKRLIGSLSIKYVDIKSFRHYLTNILSKLSQLNGVIKSKQL